MRLLNEHMPIPEMHPAAFSEKLSSRPTSINKSSDDETKAADPTENRNLYLARQVQESKTTLIQELCRLPLTALWLTHKYDQTICEAETEDETICNDENIEFLQAIKYNFDRLISNSAGVIKSSGRNKFYSRLQSSLAEFPFAFDDLVVLVDLVIHEAKLLRVSVMSDTSLTSRDVEIVNKRLNGDLNWLSKHNLSKTSFSGQINQDIAFLMNGFDDLAQRISTIILAEKNWLSSRQLLATANSKLVLFIANQYKGNFLDFEDLVQEGNAGLLKAVDRFKHQLGFQFSTYAGYWIRQAISRALSRSERVVRIPCGQIALINKVFRVKDELTLKLGKEPDSQQLAEHTGLTQNEINNVLAISQTSVPLEYFGEDEEESFAPIDFLEQRVFTHCADTIADKQLESIVNLAIRNLNPREAKIITSHFGVGTDKQSTLQEIGSEFNLTRERVRQIQVVALNKIRNRFGDQLLSFM